MPPFGSPVWETSIPEEKIDNDGTGVYSSGNITNYPHEVALFWKGNRSSASQKIMLILRNPKVHHRPHYSPTLFSPKPDDSNPGPSIPIL